MGHSAPGMGELADEGVAFPQGFFSPAAVGEGAAESALLQTPAGTLRTGAVRAAQAQAVVQSPSSAPRDSAQSPTVLGSSRWEERGGVCHKSPSSLLSHRVLALPSLGPVLLAHRGVCWVQGVSVG